MEKLDSATYPIRRTYGDVVCEMNEVVPHLLRDKVENGRIVTFCKGKSRWH